MYTQPIPANLAPRELRANRVWLPTEMVAVTDATVDGYYDFAAVPVPGYESFWPGTVHGGGANTLFCDGHVQWYLQKELLVTPYSEGGLNSLRIARMWNNNNKSNWDAFGYP